jgi:hypothetical protein
LFLIIVSKQFIKGPTPLRRGRCICGGVEEILIYGYFRIHLPAAVRECFLGADLTLCTSSQVKDGYSRLISLPAAKKGLLFIKEDHDNTCRSNWLATGQPGPSPLTRRSFRRFGPPPRLSVRNPNWERRAVLIRTCRSVLEFRRLPWAGEGIPGTIMLPVNGLILRMPTWVRRESS